MLKTTRHLLELIRFRHTLFALPFALLATVMACRLQYIDEFVTRYADTTEVGRDETLPELIDLRANGLVEQIRVRLDSHKIGVWHGFAIRWQEIVGILLC